MQSNVMMDGKVTMRLTPPTEGVGLGWKLKNLPNVWRGWWRRVVAKWLGIPTMYATLRLVLWHKGRKIDYGLVATRVVTDVYVQHLTDVLQAADVTFSDYKYHGSGTGVAVEAVADIALGTEVESRATGTQVEGANPNEYKSQGTIQYNATYSITEHGLFNAGTGGNLLDRSVFTAIAVNSGDQIQFTYTLTCSSGG